MNKTKFTMGVQLRVVISEKGFAIVGSTNHRFKPSIQHYLERTHRIDVFYR